MSGEDAYVVLNAGCRDKDIEHIRGQLKKFQVSISVLPGATLHVSPNPNAFCTPVYVVSNLYYM